MAKRTIFQRLFFGLPAIVCVFLIGVLLTYNQWYRLKPDVAISKKNKQLLIHLADSALRSLDVPVGAILLYDGEIIGKGFNTVFADSNAGGHAEINALSAALKKIGPNLFGRLNHDKLVMISTFEPCAMCCGAMLEYGIDKVLFLKPKSWRNWFKNTKNRLEYNWLKNTVKGGEKIQDSLFYLHPGYPEK